MKKRVIKKYIALMSLGFALSLSACQSTFAPSSTTQTTISANDAFAKLNMQNGLYYQTLPQSVGQDSLFNALILQTRYFINNNDFTSANANLTNMQSLAQSPLEHSELNTLKASNAFINKDLLTAFDTLRMVNIQVLPTQALIYYYSLNAKVNEQLLAKNNVDLYFNNAYNSYKALLNLVNNDYAYDIATKALRLMQKKSPSELSLLLQNAADYNDKAFYQYALIEKTSNVNAKEKLLADFKENYKGHILASIDKTDINTSTIEQNTDRTYTIEPLKEGDKIAVILPLSGRFAQGVGNVAKLGILAAIQNNKTNFDVVFYDSNSEDLGTIIDQINNDGTKLIIGPILKENVSKLISSNNKLPAIVFNTTDQTMPNNMLYFDLSPEFEGMSVAHKLLNDNHNQVLVVSGHSQRQERNLNGLKQALADSNVILTQCYYQNTNTLNQDLANCNFVKPDAVYLNASATDANLIKAKVNANKAVYLSNIGYSGVNNSGIEMSLKGATLGDMPWLLTESRLKVGFLENIGKANIQSQRIFAVSYDSITVALSLAELQASDANTINGLSGDIHLQGKLIYTAPMWVQLGTPR